MRPTVATTTWAPERSCDCWERIGAPPKTATISMSEVLGVGAQRLRHLDAELAGRGEDDRLHLVVLGVEVLQQRQAEGGGLAGPGLRLADHVVAGEQLGDRLLLDRRRLVEAELVERLLDVRREAEVLEGGQSPSIEGSRRSLPVRAAGDQVFVGPRRLRERVDVADRSVELARGERAEQLADHRREPGRAAPAGAPARNRSPSSSRAAAPRSRPSRCSREAIPKTTIRPSGASTPSSASKASPPLMCEDRVDPLAAVGLADRGAEVLGRGSRRWRRRRARRPARASPRSRRAPITLAPARLASCTRERAGAAGGGLDHDRLPRLDPGAALDQRHRGQPLQQQPPPPASSSTSSGIGTSVASGTRDLLRVAAAAEQRGDAAAVGGAAADLGAGDQRQLLLRRGSRCGSRGCRRS